MAFPNVRDCVWKMAHGLDGVPKNEQALGLWVYLDMLYDYVEMLVSLTASYYQRVANAGYVVTFLGINARGQTLAKNSLSRETFQDLLISCHFIVMLIADFGLHFPHLECPLDRTREDGCEVFFSLNGSWVQNHHAYTILDMVRNHASMTRIAEINSTNQKLKFRRSNSKQDNIWDKQYEPGNRSKTYDLKGYPTPEEVVTAWREGIAKAHHMARLVGLHHAETNESDGVTDDDDNDDRSLPEWFLKPYKNVTVSQLVHNMASDQDMEDEIAEPSTTSDLESPWGSLDERDSALFGDSQRLLSNTLHQVEITEDQEANERRQHNSHILVPEINTMVHKAKLIKQLAKNKKVSSDRLIWVQQAQEPRDTASEEVSDEGEDSRHNVGLWDDIAFESDHRYGPSAADALSDVYKEAHRVCEAREPAT